MNVPRVVIAAPSSGSGKTTVATGLMAALRGRGLAVSPHKVGPDYIDPGYHTLATGLPGRNLDPWLTSEELLLPLLSNGSAGADIAVVEGVMGLFDGAATGEFASTAHVAKVIGAPVVLVVDASSAGRSVAALVHGFISWDSGVRIGGVILNRIASQRHEEICRTAIEETGLPVLGVLRRHDEITTPSRHLGLIPAAERRPEAVAAVARLGTLIAESCDLDAILALARTAPALAAERWSAAAALAAGRSPTEARSAGGAGSGGEQPVVAVAGGAAFTFGYAENVELLEAAGARVERFDPLRDESLPAGTRGLVIGGGFPEMYTAELSANEALRAQVAKLARSGAPIYAECAGLAYLTHDLDGAAMCGVIDARATMTGRLTLGYRDAVAIVDSPVTRVGERVRGHEFHRTVVRPGGSGHIALWRFVGGSAGEGFAVHKCVASYLHLHWAGSPQVAARIVREAWA